MALASRVAALLILALGACTEQEAPDPDPGPEPDPDPQPTRRIEVTLDNLEPGWRVTTSRLGGAGTPTDTTIIADGAPLTLVGTNLDPFSTTITDATGALVGTQSMAAHCTLSEGRSLAVPSEYGTIQAAIDAAQPGDTVRVAAGTYTESLIMKAGICLHGAGARHTTLDARGETRTLVDLTGSPGSVVTGFTFRGTRVPAGCAQPADPFACSGDWYRAGIYLGGLRWDDPTTHAPPVIFNNVFEDNQIGVMLNWHGASVVRNNVFVHNDNGFVANNFASSRALVANNVFYENRDLAIGNQAAYLDIQDNIIVGSAEGIHFEFIQTGFIRCNTFWDNAAHQADTFIAPPRFAIGEDGNVEIEPQFVDAANGDFHIPPGAPGHDTGCHSASASEPDGSPYDRGAYGGPLAAWIEL
ncbi:MAG TPA: NosD domain-containing protein [Kofleriaceae bacterium]|nr:NosD domain-containing protein [Kofleriaceae bacterium]